MDYCVLDVSGSVMASAFSQYPALAFLVTGETFKIQIAAIHAEKVMEKVQVFADMVELKAGETFDIDDVIKRGNSFTHGGSYATECTRRIFNSKDFDKENDRIFVVSDFMEEKMTTEELLEMKNNLTLISLPGSFVDEWSYYLPGFEHMSIEDVSGIAMARIEKKCLNIEAMPGKHKSPKMI